MHLRHFCEAAAAVALRHVCIPDDISLAASLTASGLRPGWTVLLLLMGVSTNLPELSKAAILKTFRDLSASVK